MANSDHIEILNRGVEAWNAWRDENPQVKPDLSRENLKKQSLCSANLSSTDLRDAHLGRADLGGADLTDADLTGANLQSANLRSATLRRTVFTNSVLVDAVLDDADFQGADLRRADLRGNSFIGANFRNAILRGCNFSRTNFRRADLHGADLTHSDFRSCNFIATDLGGADLTGAQLRGADLRRADLEGANLNGTDFTEADLRGAILLRAEFPDAKLFDAKFDHSIHDHPNVKPESLVNAIIFGANQDSVAPAPPASDPPTPAGISMGIKVDAEVIRSSDRLYTTDDARIKTGDYESPADAAITQAEAASKAENVLQILDGLVSDTGGGGTSGNHMPVPLSQKVLDELKHIVRAYAELLKAPRVTPQMANAMHELLPQLDASRSEIEKHEAYEEPLALGHKVTEVAKVANTVGIALRNLVLGISAMALAVRALLSVFGVG